MERMYFVKQKIGRSSGSLLSGLGAIPLGDEIVLYKGEDEDLAKAIVENLREGVISSYSHDPERGTIIVGHASYRNGKCSRAESSGLRDENPMQGLLESMLGFSARRESLADVFGRFTSDEVKYLNSIKDEGEKDEAA